MSAGGEGAAFATTALTHEAPEGVKLGNIVTAVASTKIPYKKYGSSTGVANIVT